jgi:hypothetical protein
LSSYNHLKSASDKKNTFKLICKSRIYNKMLCYTRNGRVLFLMGMKTMSVAVSKLKQEQVQNISPPNSPWQGLEQTESSGGYLSIYYSDNLSRLPVRAVTKSGDNKSDPNIETMTYGLFSTCSRSMRCGIVDKKSRYLFFATARNKIRVLSGYYDLGWYALTISAAERDFCIAAKKAMFIAEPIPLSEIDRLCATDLSKWFRGIRSLSAETANKLRDILDTRGDATSEYLAEIDRLERFNLKHGGYRYISWKQEEKFSWEIAKRYLSVMSKAEQAKDIKKVKNSTQNDRWTCNNCSQTITNKALLRRCPNCGELATLRAAVDQ